MSKPLHIGVYPGTFDPITFGHIDIIQRATRLVDRLIIAVATNVGKAPLFSIEDRIQMIEKELESFLIPTDVEVIVKPFDSLLVNFAKSEGAQVLIRGLRAISDFEYEFQMVGTNRKLCAELETVFLVASESYQFIASNLVKEIARLKGNTTPFVSEHVAKKLEEQFSESA
ncbi:MAG TPA: pantetheine-phosphate adenylyltransferase [Alphaproteobacteria bacterium]|nr:pantetheine-phosphate adenylyltransferase [Alphaproteobacteria bacterium]